MDQNLYLDNRRMDILLHLHQYVWVIVIFTFMLADFFFLVLLMWCLSLGHTCGYVLTILGCFTGTAFGARNWRNVQPCKMKLRPKGDPFLCGPSIWTKTFKSWVDNFSLLWLIFACWHFQLINNGLDLDLAMLVILWCDPCVLLVELFTDIITLMRRDHSNSLF